MTVLQLIHMFVYKELLCCKILYLFFIFKILTKTNIMTNDIHLSKFKKHNFFKIILLLLKQYYYFMYFSLSNHTSNKTHLYFWMYVLIEFSKVVNNSKREYIGVRSYLYDFKPRFVVFFYFSNCLHHRLFKT